MDYTLSPRQLARYLAHIGVPDAEAARRPEEVHRRHALTFAWSNADVYLGKPVGLDLDAIVEKMLGRRAGGYCYEHNLLLASAYAALGIPVRLHAARTLLNAIPERSHARTHLVLVASWRGAQWLADVGFGAHGLIRPLALQPGAGIDPEFRVRAAAHDAREVHGLLRGSWTPLYTMAHEPCTTSDVAMMHHFSATAPDSRFRKRLVIARVGEADRRFLRGLRLESVHGRMQHVHGVPAERLRSVLESDFGIVLDDQEAQELAERVCQGEPDDRQRQ